MTTYLDSNEYFCVALLYPISNHIKLLKQVECESKSYPMKSYDSKQ